MKLRFVPDTWILTDRLRAYARSKGLSDKQIDDQEEAFRLCQFPRQILCFDRAWQRWIRNGIEWGKIVPSKPPSYRRPEEYTEDQRKADIAAWQRDVQKLKIIK